jgi:hypothetical protein
MIQGVNSVFVNLLRVALWPKISILEKVSFVAEKNVYCMVVG